MANTKAFAQIEIGKKDGKFFVIGRTQNSDHWHPVSKGFRTRKLAAAELVQVALDNVVASGWKRLRY
jgi:hypothetical protein